MCEFCREDSILLERDVADDTLLAWCIGSKITIDSISYNKEVVVLDDRGYLRLCDPDDMSCLDHGQKVKIYFCPFCGRKLEDNND